MANKTASKQSASQPAPFLKISEEPLLGGPADAEKDAGRAGAAASGQQAEISLVQADGKSLKHNRQVRAVAEQYQLFEHASKSLFKKYEAAIREMQTRFEILDADLEYRFNRNPIHHIETRVKTAQSVFGKLERYGVPITLKSMEENILDIAGMRVIVSYIDDVYALVKVLSLQDDLQIIKVKDYIKNPKPNGYRSLHIIVRVPVYFLDRKQYVPVEIQFRTIAMDFWASLEHTLKYKQDVHLEGIDMFDELKDCADLIEDVEKRMQILMHAVQTTDVEEAARKRREQLEKLQNQEVDKSL